MRFLRKIVQSSRYHSRPDCGFFYRVIIIYCWIFLSVACRAIHLYFTIQIKYFRHIYRRTKCIHVCWLNTNCSTQLYIMMIFRFGTKQMLYRYYFFTTLLSNFSCKRISNQKRQIKSKTFVFCAFTRNSVSWTGWSPLWSLTRYTHQNTNWNIYISYCPIYRYEYEWI